MENPAQENIPVKPETGDKEKVSVDTPTKGEKRPLTESNAEVSPEVGGEEAVETDRIVKRPRLTRDVLKTVVTPTCTAPVPWKADIGADGSALYVDEHEVIMGTVDGKVLFLDVEGRPRRVIQLPCPVGSIFRDGRFLYAWCHASFSFDKWKGALFDLSGDDPRVLFDFQEFGEWVKFASAHEDKIVLCDDKGSIVALDSEGNPLWQRLSTETSCKVFLTDAQGLYVGYQKKVARHSWSTGEEVWSYSVSGRFAKVIHGAQDKQFLYIEAGGRIVQLDKATGEEVQEFCPARHRASGVCVGRGILVTGSCPTVIFDIKTGKEIVRLNLPGRMADAHMKMHISGQLFIAWDEIICVDLNKHSLTRAMEGKSTRTEEIKLTDQKVILPRDVISITSDPGNGVVVKCLEKDGKLEVFPVSEGYESSWPVRFPVLLRYPDVKYVVDELLASEKYKFYSVIGDIRELVDPIPAGSAVSTPLTQRPIRSKPNTPLGATPVSRGGSKTATPYGADTPVARSAAPRGAQGSGSPYTPSSKMGALQLDTPVSRKSPKQDLLDAKPEEESPSEKLSSSDADMNTNEEDPPASAPESADQNPEAVVDTMNKSYKQALMEGIKE